MGGGYSDVSHCPWFHIPPNHSYYIFTTSTSTLHTIYRAAWLRLLKEHLTIGYVHTPPGQTKHADETDAEIWSLGFEGEPERLGIAHFPRPFVSGRDLLLVIERMPKGIELQDGAVFFTGF